MHGNGYVSNNLSDVFPSIPMQDSIVNGTIGGPLTNNLNANVDVASRMKYLGMNFSPQLNHSISLNSGFLSEDRSRTNLIINYLPQSFDQTDLQRLFERVGPIRQCKLIRDKNTGASLCYGFVDFVNPQHAALAIQTYHGYETEQKRLRVAYASSGGRRFTPGHRMPPINGSSSSGLGVEVTNENVIGWEVFVVGIPLEWTESDLLRLFTNFGNVILLRILAPQLSESPPSHKARMNSPVLNGASSDISSESVESGRVTTTASVIFEDKSSAEQSVIRLNGYHAPDWSAPLRLRIIGSVTRETYGLFCFSSRQSPALGLSRLPNAQNPGEPLNESDVLCNLMNRKAITTSGCVPNGPFVKSLDTIGLPSTGDPHLNNSFPMPPRAIIRNKTNEGGSTSLSHMQHGHLELMDLLDTHSALSAATNACLGNTASDRLHGRELSIASALAARASEHEQSKLDSSLRALTSSQHSPWAFPQSRSLLNALPDAVRTSDTMGPGWPSSGYKRLSIKTPVISSSILSNVASQRGGQIQIWLKLDNLQPTGSFKIRGMENACRKWASAGVTHVVCPSGGNAAIAAAYCAQAYGLTCTVVVPEPNEAVIRRRLSCEAPDTKVVVHGFDWLEANHRAEQLVNDLQANHSGEQSVRLLHPYDQTDLWEGYETVIDEFSSEMGQPDVIVLAVGGGGLLAGVIQGLWNRGWSSTHVITVETEGADCLNRSLKAGQLLLVPRSTSIASSLVAPVLAHRSWNLAQLQSLTPVVCSDVEALDASKRFLDDHGMLVEPACGASLSVVYSGVLTRLQLEGRIPRPANVVIMVGGSGNVSLRQLTEWDSQLFHPSEHHISVSPFLTTTSSSAYMSRTSPHAILSSDLTVKQSLAFSARCTTAQDPNETLKFDASTPSTPRATTVGVLGHAPVITESTESMNGERDGTIDANALNPNDLVNFSKLLAPSEGEAEEGGLRD